MTKLGDMSHIPVTDRLNKRRPCVQKTIGRSGTLFCHFLLILVAGNHRLQACMSACLRCDAAGGAADRRARRATRRGRPAPRRLLLRPVPHCVRTRAITTPCPGLTLVPTALSWVVTPTIRRAWS
jgi:hypothetical protein